VRIELVVEGVTEGRTWQCGLELDHANEESVYCRPLRIDASDPPTRMPVPAEAAQVRLAFLPPKSGLTANELRLDPGAIDVRIGEGRTAEVLRNLCHRVRDGAEGPARWIALVNHMRQLFGVELDPPEYVAARGEITMTYRMKGEPEVRLDLSASGRGLQQTLLLLAYLYQHPGAVLLLDEPDAHLEILRQRQIYNVLTDVASQQGCQIVAASHSEVVLNEAADKDVVVAFVGKPHRIDDRGHPLTKALKSIGFEHYYLAEQTGWVLYLEGATDLAILRAFAKTLNHPARSALERPFMHPVGNQPAAAREHFFGLREAKRDLVGFAVFDRMDLKPTDPALGQHAWARREIENYLCFPEVLEGYARRTATVATAGPLFLPSEEERRVEAMKACVEALVPPVALSDHGDPFWRETKASDQLLDRVFEMWFARLEMPNLMRKADYHHLAGLVPEALLDDEIRRVLDEIHATPVKAAPERDEV
jgi:hypothetical protein